MNKKHNKLLGFTLAELMVVLAILGVISAVLLPTVFDSMPDENRLRFKKGYYTLKRTIDLLVNSDAYNTTRGQFGEVKQANAEGEPEPVFTYDAKYFCVQFSQALNTTDAQCDTFVLKGPSGTGTVAAGTIADSLNAANVSTAVDGYCDQITTGSVPNLVTQDGVSWFLPSDTFSFKDTANEAKDLKVGGVTYKNIPAYHSTICMDVDKVGSGQAPFGFGIRTDGRVVAGARAKEWLQEGTKKMLTDQQD